MDDEEQLEMVEEEEEEEDDAGRMIVKGEDEEEEIMKEEECCRPSSSEENSQDGTSTPMTNGGDEPEFTQKYYDIEPCYYSLTGKSDRSCRGKVYRYREDSDLKGFQSHDGCMYKLRDSVYVELAANEPFVIATIVGFKYTKREHVVVKLTRYFRAEDIPEMSLNLMKQERAELNINPHLCPQSLNRELFNSELAITQPVSCLRGKCNVEYVTDIRTARQVADFSLDNDTFFYCLHYNQDSTRLASTHYEIRVGSAFQARLPPMPKCNVGDEQDRDELLYRPGSIEEETEQEYVQLARCFRTYTLSTNNMLDAQKNSKWQSEMHNFQSQVSDLLMDEAICQLHRSGYKVDDALNELTANDVILATDVDYMTLEDAKRFAKGIKSLGKNFTRIHRELLPHHSREQLVSYYYLWKKTPEATKPKQAARRINQTSIKRPAKEKMKSLRAADTEYLDFDSASESDVENNGPLGRACHHCFGIDSKDWHHANGLLLCTECRLYYKKYGQLRNVANRPTQVPACLFKRATSGEEEESGVRTRAGKKENNRRRTPSSMSETPDRTRSPAMAATSSNGSNIDEISPIKRPNGVVKRNTKRPLNGNSQVNGEKKVLSEQSICEASSSPPSEYTNGFSVENAESLFYQSELRRGNPVSKKPRMDLDEEMEDDDDDDEPKMTIDEGDSDDMPTLETVVKKEEPIDELANDVKPETSPLTNGVHKSEIVEDEAVATTSNGVKEVSKVEEEDKLKPIVPTDANFKEKDLIIVDYDQDEDYEEDDGTDTSKISMEIEFTTKSANFIRNFVRSCGPMCSRTDLQYKFKEESEYAASLKKKKERQVQERHAQELANAQKAAQASAQVNQHAQNVQMRKEAVAQASQAAHLPQHPVLAAAVLAGMPPAMYDQLHNQQMLQQHLQNNPMLFLQQYMHQPHLQQLAMQQHQQHEAHSMMQMQQEIQNRIFLEHQRAAAAAAAQQQAAAQAAAAQREREQREQRERQERQERLEREQAVARERAQRAAAEAAAAQQQQQQQQIQMQHQQQIMASIAQNPQMAAMLQGLIAVGPQRGVDVEGFLQIFAQQQQAQQQAQQQQAQQAQQQQQQRQQQQAQREREAREARERDLARQREAAQAQQQQQQQAQQAQQQQQQQQMTPLEIQHQQLLLQQIMMMQQGGAPAFLAQLSAQQNPMLQHPQPGNQSEMMRRLHADSRPQHP